MVSALNEYAEALKSCKDPFWEPDSELIKETGNFSVILFTQLIQTFLNHYKSNTFSLNDLYKMCNNKFNHNYSPKALISNQILSGCK